MTENILIKNISKKFYEKDLTINDEKRTYLVTDDKELQELLQDFSYDEEAFTDYPDTIVKYKSMDKDDWMECISSLYMKYPLDDYYSKENVVDAQFEFDCPVYRRTVFWTLFNYLEDVKGRNVLFDYRSVSGDCDVQWSRGSLNGCVVTWFV